MLNWLLILGIAIANNLDNTGVGIALGVGRIRLPLLVNAWIAAITFALTAAAAAGGNQLGSLLPVHAAKIFSALILCGVGVTVMWPSAAPRPGRPSKPKGPLRRVLSDPVQADRDRSSHVDFREGSLLGIALSLNNLGGGLSAGLLHLSFFWIAFLSALLSFAVLLLGTRIGRYLGGAGTAEQVRWIAGGMLIGIGLFQLH